MRICSNSSDRIVMIRRGKKQDAGDTCYPKVLVVRVCEVHFGYNVYTCDKGDIGCGRAKE